MWFELASGVETISIDFQQYKAEASWTDKDEREHFYFRAPDNLASRILDLPGFKAVSNPPNTQDIPDLPKFDPENAANVERLSKQVTAATEERDRALDALKPLQSENVDLRRRLAISEANLAKATEVVGAPKK